MLGFGFAPRLCPSTPRLTRSIVNKTALRPVPSPRVFPQPPDRPNASPLKISTPQDFLKAIGRSSEEKLEPESWEAFWKTSGQDMRKAGLAVKDRRHVLFALSRVSFRQVMDDSFCRYILWCMEKYRLGLDPRKFAHEPKPKKTVRGCVVSVSTSQSSIQTSVYVQLGSLGPERQKNPFKAAKELELHWSQAMSLFLLSGYITIYYG